MYSVVKRDARARRELEEVKRKGFRVVEKEKRMRWEEADEVRGGRPDGRKREPILEELPAITMVDTRWATGDEKAAPTQSSLLAGKKPEPRASASEGIYKTGVNPFFQSAATKDVEVEEVADLMVQAELLITLHNYDEAINLLARHIRETEKPAPRAWLMLFEMFALTDRREQYNNLAKGFRILFNAQVPSWDEQASGSRSKTLEDYGKVMEKVQRLWGMPTCRAFLESLLYDDRGGNRQGFMLAAYSDILFLLDLIDAADQIAQEEEERRKIELKMSQRPFA
jgi:hypothetical protein